MPGDPERLGGCWLAARLGAGGRGVVYDAYDDEGRRFAVTVPRGEVGRRYERVTCRRLAEVVAVGSDDGVPYVVSEYVDGPDLRQAVALHGPYTGDELVALAGALAEALRALHEAGLTHRGLNPESVLLAGDGPKVIELGLPVAGPVGAYTYQAPEVLTGQAAEAPADVFAWGAVVLFAASGDDPFCGESLGGIMHRLLTVDPDLSCLPDSLCELVGRALAKDPAARPTAAELVVDSEAEVRPPEAYVRQRSLGELAEEVYAELTPAQQQEVPGLLLRLLDGDTPHDEGDVLRPLMEAGLLVRRSVRVPAVETSVGKLVAVSDDRVAPASAALYRAWPRLRGWVADEREGMVVHRHIRQAARQWSQHRRGRGHLLRGHELDTALGWAATKRRHVRLNQLERDFIHDSVALSKQRRKLLMPSLASVAAVLAVAVTMTVVSVHGQNDLRERLIQADARAVAARAETLRTSDPRTAMRLSVAAWRLAPVFEARAALQASLVQPELGVFTDPDAEVRARYLLRGDTLVRWDTGSLTVWDVPSRRRVASYALPADTAALSDDGRYAESLDGGPLDVTTGRAPAGTVYAISRGNRTRVYRGTRVLLDVTDAKVAVSPDGTRAAVSRLTGRVELWNLVPRRASRTGAVEVDPLTGADAAAPALAFSPDGRTLAVAGRDGVTLVGSKEVGSRAGAVEMFGAAVEPGPDTPADLGRVTQAGPNVGAVPSPGVLALPVPSPSPTQPSPGSAASQAPVTGGSPPSAGTTQAPAADASRSPAAVTSQAPVASASRVPTAGASQSTAPQPHGTGQAARPGGDAETASPTGRRPSTEQADGQGDGQGDRRGDGQGDSRGDSRGDGQGDGRGGKEPGEDGAWGVEVVDGLETPPGASAGPLVFSPDGNLLALPGDGEVRVWNVAERRLAGSYPLKDPGHDLTFSSDGRQLRYLSGIGSVVSLDVSGLPAPSDDGHIAAFSGNGRVAAKEVGNAIELTDTEQRRKLGRIAAAGDLAFDAGGRLLAVAGDPVTVWEVSGGRQVATIEAGGDVPAVALSPDGGTLATARGRTLETWDVRTARRIKAYEGAGDLALAFSPDGTTLAAGPNLLDLPTGRITPLDLTDAAAPTALAFSSDGRRLAIALEGGRVLLWDVRERRSVGTIETGSAPVDELRFSPGGDLLAVDAGRTSLWDTTALREVGQVGPWAAGLAFSQDGKRLRGVALDGTVREVAVDPGLTAREVCARAGGALTRAEWARLIPESDYQDSC
ncbi:protein kinase domain-containing protein [Nonomuraea gerenzanensis]|uniref:Putative serine/threonine protein kinase n=1 Tax=Nonomuraea gerenzanensis TaxID=93944 RepID=A0A1M4ENA5_9ACTN|nr:protein kinase [Nonomuraea gerenzanensis]UBU11799.1 protein kinase [Nonomuraea gerenzanensis]SBP00304.1 putative serine/threonine protein kinase [Nonomuraea gerenzanensis]